MKMDITRDINALRCNIKTSIIERGVLGVGSKGALMVADPMDGWDDL
jgi:hypothetical protein